jgi:hypothetical protein
VEDMGRENIVSEKNLMKLYQALCILENNMAWAFKRLELFEVKETIEEICPRLKKP